MHGGDPFVLSIFQFHRHRVALSYPVFAIPDYQNCLSSCPILGGRSRKQPQNNHEGTVGVGVGDDLGFAVGVRVGAGDGEGLAVGMRMGAGDGEGLAMGVRVGAGDGVGTIDIVADSSGIAVAVSFE
jgi:hypothetical protein